ncbi:MAG: hypothetical protein AVDCRST_MAG40-1159, partial [uncultured Gemmatimonadaceae bacterium]
GRCDGARGAGRGGGRPRRGGRHQHAAGRAACAAPPALPLQRAAHGGAAHPRGAREGRGGRRDGGRAAPDVHRGAARRAAARRRVAVRVALPRRRADPLRRPAPGPQRDPAGPARRARAVVRVADPRGECGAAWGDAACGADGDRRLGGERSEWADPRRAQHRRRRGRDRRRGEWYGPRAAAGANRRSLRWRRDAHDAAAGGGWLRGGARGPALARRTGM